MYGGEVMPGQRAGLGITKAGQLYYEDDPFCPSGYITHLCLEVTLVSAAVIAGWRLLLYKVNRTLGK